MHWPWISKQEFDQSWLTSFLPGLTAPEGLVGEGLGHAILLHSSSPNRPLIDTAMHSVNNTERGNLGQRGSGCAERGAPVFQIS